MPQFNQDFVEKVRTAVDIVDLISRDIKLTQRGKNYVGLCPFHDEKTPSFNVNRENQLYNCFGCGSGGNIFNYLMNTRHLSFPEAVQFLAQQAGIELPHQSPAQRELASKAQKLRELNRLAAQYYYRMLRTSSGEYARSYLMQRGINDHLARQFYLGYAPDSWDGLVKFLQSNTELPLELAEEAGLIIKGKHGYYDRFRNRVMFPILDLNRRFIGFGGRIIGSGNPKYLNTPETIVFHKGKNLYGLNWSRDSIKQNGCIVLVEGYTDCISLHAKGVTNTAASLGTAFTEQHAKLIARLTNNVVIAFDSDQAGVKAIQRGLEILVDAGLNVKVAPLPEGLDPDTFARNHSAKEVLSWIEGAVPYLEYQINLVVSQSDINSLEGKIKAAKEIINILSKIESVIVRAEYSNYAANLLSIDPDVIVEELKRTAGHQVYEEKLSKEGRNSHITSQNRYTIKDLRTNHQNLDISSEQTEAIESCVMRILLTNPGLIDEMINAGLDADSFTNSDYSYLFQLLVADAWDKHGEAVAEQLLTAPEPPGRWSDYLQLFRENIWFRSINSIEEKLTGLENLKEPDVLLKLCQLLRTYVKVRREIFLAKSKS